MLRHDWHRKGKWHGSDDVRICMECGLVAYKTGQIYTCRTVRNIALLEEGLHSTRLTECGYSAPDEEMK